MYPDPDKPEPKLKSQNSKVKTTTKNLKVVKVGAKNGFVPQNLFFRVLGSVSPVQRSGFRVQIMGREYNNRTLVLI
jgi:hypothetical protein